MSDVWIVEVHEDYWSGDVLGVFAVEQDAKDFCERLWEQHEEEIDEALPHQPLLEAIKWEEHYAGGQSLRLARMALTYRVRRWPIIK